MTLFSYEILPSRRTPFLPIRFTGWTWCCASPDGWPFPCSAFCSPARRTRPPTQTPASRAGRFPFQSAWLFLFELTAPLAFVLVWFYNGQRGACSPLQKKAFYWFYPVHLLVLAGITNLML